METTDREKFEAVDLPLYDLVALVELLDLTGLNDLTDTFKTAKLITMTQITAGENRLGKIVSESGADDMKNHLAEYNEIQTLVVQGQFMVMLLDYKLAYLQEVLKEKEKEEN